MSFFFKPTLDLTKPDTFLKKQPTHHTHLPHPTSPRLFGALLCYIPVYGLLTVLWYGKKDFHQNVPEAFQYLVDNKTSILVPCAGVPTYNFSALAPWATIPECEYQPNIAWYYIVYIVMGIFVRNSQKWALVALCAKKKD